MPYLLWIPRLGPLLAGRTNRAAVAQASGAPPTDSVLTGRIENLTLVRAAGYASALSPDAAMVAYGASAVMTAAMGGVARLLKRVADSRGTGGARPRAEVGAAEAAARNELVVRRYLLGQLRMAEVSRHAQSARISHPSANAANGERRVRRSSARPHTTLAKPLHPWADDEMGADGAGV